MALFQNGAVCLSLRLIGAWKARTEGLSSNLVEIFSPPLTSPFSGRKVKGQSYTWWLEFKFQIYTDLAVVLQCSRLQWYHLVL